MQGLLASHCRLYSQCRRNSCDTAVSSSTRLKHRKNGGPTAGLINFLWYFSILLTTEHIHPFTHSSSLTCSSGVINRTTLYFYANPIQTGTQTHTLMEQPLGERLGVHRLPHWLWHVDRLSWRSNLSIIWQTTPPPGHCSAQEQGWQFKKVWKHQDQRLIRTLT